MKKNLPESMRAADRLPAFLDSHADAEIAAPERPADDATAASESTAGDETPDNGSDDDTNGTEATATAAALDADDAATSTGTTETTEAAAPTSSRRPRPLPPRTGGTLAMTLGLLALLGTPASVFAPTLAIYGFTPNLLLLLGALLIATGMTQRHVSRMQQRLDEAENRRREDATAVSQNLQLLVDGSQRDRAPAQGDELQHVLMQLQRQDEKINNLTKAIKMYGKPLMEISAQGPEVAGMLSTIKALVESGTESARQSINKVESQVRSANSGKDLAEVTSGLQQLVARVETLATKSHAPSLEPLQQQLGRVEVSLAAIAQRLEDSEVRKSLMRLEESTQKGREAVQELLRGDTVRQATAQLQSRVDSATKGLADGLTQLREGNLGGLEHAVREIQREVAGVATTVAQINATVKSGARTTAAAPAAASAPASSPAPTTTPAAATQTPAATATAPGGDGSPSSGGYQTGTRSSGGKNVLGAIAKLKQMKS